MIRNSFVFLERINKKKEASFWRQEINSWNDFLQAGKIKGISKEKKFYYDRKIKQARQALLNEDSVYFSEILPQKETWRLYGYFKEQCCFLDLEIDSYGKIILLGIADEFNTKIFIRNVNLEKYLIEKELKNYKLMITFNGSCFDLPKLRKQLKLEINVPHIDLKPICINLGLKGGLKEVEKQLNIRRPQNLRGNPVDLWKAFHASGDNEWLDLLIDYNKEDVENLRGIMGWVYNKMRSKLLSCRDSAY